MIVFRQTCASAHTYIREFSEGKPEVKLNGSISDVHFNRSYKCGIAGSINFRKCRITARASQRARKRKFFLATRRGTSAKFRAAHTDIPRVFERKLEVKRDALFQRLVLTVHFSASDVFFLCAVRKRLSCAQSALSWIIFAAYLFLFFKYAILVLHEAFYI